MTSSPISKTVFISWVFMMVVILNSSVILLSNSSITREVTGSSPELGSSQKRYFISSAIALAIQTRFFIPPLISAGNLLFMPFISTCSRQKSTRSLRSAGVIDVNIFNVNSTFCSTVSESNKAVP